MKRLFYLFLMMVCCLSACLEVPSQFGVDLNVETSSELGPDTLARIDAVNQTRKVQPIPSTNFLVNGFAIS